MFKHMHKIIGAPGIVSDTLIERFKIVSFDRLENFSDVRVTGYMIFKIDFNFFWIHFLMCNFERFVLSSESFVVATRFSGCS